MKEEFLQFNKEKSFKHIVITFVDMAGGKLSKGVSLYEVYDFVLEGFNATGKFLEEVAGEYETKGNASFEVKIPFAMSESDVSNLNKIIESIKSDDKYIYNERHHFVSSSEVRKYAKVSIDGMDYEMLYEDTLFKKLLDVTYYNLVSKILDASYKKYMGF